jgi:hypothetical protein
MRNLAKASTLLILMLLAGASTASAQITVRIGPPPPPRVVYVQPARPAGNVVWVNGYWYPQGKHYRWHNGYWARPPYAGAMWIAPRHVSGRYYGGYWKGGHRVVHYRSVRYYRR